MTCRIKVSSTLFYYMYIQVIVIEDQEFFFGGGGANLIFHSLFNNCMDGSTCTINFFCIQKFGDTKKTNSKFMPTLKLYFCQGNILIDFIFKAGIFFFKIINQYIKIIINKILSKQDRKVKSIW